MSDTTVVQQSLTNEMLNLFTKKSFYIMLGIVIAIGVAMHLYVTKFNVKKEAMTEAKIEDKQANTNAQQIDPRMLQALLAQQAQEEQMQQQMMMQQQQQQMMMQQQMRMQQQQQQEQLMQQQIAQQKAKASARHSESSQVQKKKEVPQVSTDSESSAELEYA